MTADLNLARRPFVNRRPVRRTAIALWVVGGLLLAANAWLYWRHFSGQGTQRAQLGEIDQRLAAASDEIGRLEGALASVDLEQQNERAAFLNDRIRERIFSWSTLFDRLAEVLPYDVQLKRVSPRLASRTAGRRRAARRASVSEPAEEVVSIHLAGAAKSGEVLLELVDRLYEHPSFERPDLANEAQDETGHLAFSLSVVYLPAADAASADEAEPAETAAEDRDRDAAAATGGSEAAADVSATESADESAGAAGEGGSTE